MTDSQLFRVTFSGVLTGEYDLAQTQNRFSRLFRIPSEKVKQLFSGKEYTLKNKVSEAVAMKFAIRLAETGCESVIEKISEFEYRNKTGQIQERRAAQRRIRFRRAPRKGALIPDRRLLASRRQEDQAEPTQRLAG
jgi:hypothetical protein